MPPPNRVDVTYSVSANQLSDLIALVYDQLLLVPARLTNPDPTPSAQKLFINYRRIDSEDVCGRIYDRLCGSFPEDQIFRDINDIAAGENFADSIREAVEQCQVMLCLMGSRWDDADNLPRLHEADDYLRLEIASALSGGLTVIPIWVGRREVMPQPETLPADLTPLVYLNARKVRCDPDFHTDMDRLIEDIKALLNLPDRFQSP